MPEIHKEQSFAGNAGIQVYGLEGKNVKLQVKLIYSYDTFSSLLNEEK